MNAGAGGEVVPFERASVPAVKDEYQQAIRLWCVDRNLSDALRPDEIGSLQALDRIDAQRKAIIIGLSHYYRKHERADVAPGVAVVIALLSDNEKGLATISQPTLAQLFGRSRSAIGDAQKRLKDDGLIGMTRGRYAGSFPIVPREVTRSYNHMTWLIEALNTQDGPVNLPAPSVDCQSTGPVGGLKQSTGRSGGLKSVNQPVEPISINRPDATQLHYKTSLETTLERGREDRSLSRAVATVAMGIASAATTIPLAAAPMEPTAIVQSVKAEVPYEELKAKLMEAGGAAIGTAPDLEVMALPRSWIAAGADLDEDILPTIRARAAKMPPRSVASWKYFAQAIADTMRKRREAMPAGHLRPERSDDPPWKQKERDRLDAFFKL